MCKIERHMIFCAVHFTYKNVEDRKDSKTLDWRPEVNFEDGIQKTIRWYLSNRVWWENLINEDIRS